MYENDENKRKLIWICPGCYFTDSLLWFKEHDFKIFAVKLNISPALWNPNLDIIKSLGAEIINNTPENMEKLCKIIDKNTLIISGSNFMNIQKERVGEEGINSCIEQLEILYKLTKYNNEKNIGAKSVRYFNGDTGFSTQEMIDKFTYLTKYVDIFMFDNDLLKEFVLFNIPSAKNKKIMVEWFETPLKRFVYHNQNSICKNIIILGRLFCSHMIEMSKIDRLPIKRFPLPKKLKWKDKIRGRKNFYLIAGLVPDLQEMYNNRKLFFKWEAKSAFGLSHLYDIFSGSVANFREHKDFFFSLFGQKLAHNILTNWEAYYPFTNTPNKDVCYLMNGIIPLISHVEHSFYQALIEKKMGILIEKVEDIEAALQMSNKEIQEYRDNIYMNMDMYTFDHIGELLTKELE